MGNSRGSQTGGQRAKIKNYSQDNLLKETELKAALTGSTVGQKQPAKESTTIEKKEKCLRYAPNLKLQKGKMLKLMKV